MEIPAELKFRRSTALYNDAYTILWQPLTCLGMSILFHLHPRTVALGLSTLGSFIFLYYLYVNKAITASILYFGDGSLRLPTKDNKPQQCAGPPGLPIAADLSHVSEVWSMNVPLPLVCTKLICSCARIPNTSVGIF